MIEMSKLKNFLCIFLFIISLDICYSDSSPNNVTNSKPDCNGSVSISLTFEEPNVVKEMINLLIQSINLKFNEGLSKSLKLSENVAWRVAHIEAMGRITKKSCPRDLVSPKFINSLMNYAMIYYESIHGKMEMQSKANSGFWNNLLSLYKACEDKSPSIGFISQGGVAYQFVEFDENRTIIGDIRQIRLEAENADSLLQMDFIIEGIWYMFQVVAGTCYGSVKGARTMWLANYLLNFKIDFTDPFGSWWASPIPINYGLLFGDTDLTATLYNLRACAAVGFQNSKILDRLPVRPINTDGTHMNVRKEVI